MLGLPGGASVHADTAREILEELIDGYANLPTDDARLAARQRHALDQVTLHQETMITRALVDGRVQEDDPDDAALIALLREVRGQAIGLGEGDAPQAHPQWRGAVPLVVLATAYAPHTDTPLPGGHVHVIDPVDEDGYLLGLRRAGALDYWAEA